METTAAERRQMISAHLKIKPQPFRESEADVEAIQIAIQNLIDRGDIAALTQLSVMAAGAVQQALIK